MIVCRVVGQAVSTAKDEGLRAASLLLVRPVDSAGADLEGEPIVAVDAVGAGLGELVLVAQGSAVRQSARISGPADAAIVAIVDSLSLDGRRTYTK